MPERERRAGDRARGSRASLSALEHREPARRRGVGSGQQRVQVGGRRPVGGGEDAAGQPEADDLRQHPLVGLVRGDVVGQVEGGDPAGDAEHRAHPVRRGQQPLDGRARPRRSPGRSPRGVPSGRSPALRSRKSATRGSAGSVMTTGAGTRAILPALARAGTEDSVDDLSVNSSSVEFISR